MCIVPVFPFVLQQAAALFDPSIQILPFDRRDDARVFVHEGNALFYARKHLLVA